MNHIPDAKTPEDEVKRMQDDILNRQIKNWEDRLLDLGKRNRMISFRPTRRSTLNILTPTMEELYRQVVVGERELKFQRPITRDSEPRMFAALTLMDALSSPMEVCVGDIRAEGDLTETARTLRNLRSRAKLAMDEQGCNILYLIFGFIEWKEKGSKQDTWLRSPLLLAPASLSQPNINGPYFLRRREDEVVVNPTLSYLFARDYDVQLPEFDDDRDDLEAYFRKLEELADGQGWRILRQSSLALVSFQKISMYNDLVRNEDNIRLSPIIRALAGESNAVSQPLPQDSPVEHDTIPSAGYHQVLSADSSQQDAIALSRQGVSFVLQGPPGTGKSQTIANIIAQGVADGKKILFVSEKMAALDVVHKRLSDVNLAEFCLPVHSHKANKRDILRQLETSLDLKHLRLVEETLLCYPRLDMVTRELREYVTQLHTPRSGLNISIYDACGALAKRESLPEIPLVYSGAEQISREKLDHLSLMIQKMDRSRSALKGDWRSHPWEGYRNGYLQTGEKKELKRLLEELVSALEKLTRIRLDAVTLADVVHYDQLEELETVLEAVCGCAMLSEHWNYRDIREPEALLAGHRELASAMEIAEARVKELCSGEIPDSRNENTSDALNRALNTIGALNEEAPEDTYRKIDHYADKLEVISGLRKALDAFLESFTGFYRLPSGSLDPERVVELCGLNQELGGLEEQYFPKDKFLRMQELFAVLSEACRIYHGSSAVLSGKFRPEILELSNAGACLERLTGLSEKFLWLLPEYRRSYLQIQEIARVKPEELASFWSLEDAACLEKMGRRFGFAPAVTLGQALSHRDLLNCVSDGSAGECWIQEEDRERSRQILTQALEKAETRESAEASFRQNTEKLSLNLPAGSFDRENFERIRQLAVQPEDAELLSSALDATDGWETLSGIENAIVMLRNWYGRLQTLLLEGNARSLGRELLNLEYWQTHGAASVSEPRICWAGNWEKAYGIVEEARKLAEIVKTDYARITAACENHVFDLDYMGILNRFKTEYTGIFCHLMPRYRRDMNQLRLAFRDVRRKITEDEAIGLLMELRTYHAHLEQYQALRPRLNNWFGIDRFDMHFDWSAVKERLDGFYRFAELFRTEDAAVTFLQAGNWSKVEEILRECGRYAAELENNSRATALFAGRYQKEHTDTTALRRDLETVRNGLALFRNRGAYLDFLRHGVGSPEFAELLEKAEAVRSCDSWFRHNCRGIELAAGEISGLGSDQLKEKLEQLSAYSEAAQLFGEENLRQWVRRNGGFHGSYSSLFEELTRLEQLLQRLGRGEAGTDEVLNLAPAEVLRRLKDGVFAAREWLNLSSCVTQYLWTTDRKVLMRPEEIHDSLDAVLKYRKNREILEVISREAEELFGADFAGIDTNWGRIARKIDLRKGLEELAGREIPGALRDVATAGGPLWPFGDLKELLEKCNALRDARTVFGSPQDAAQRERNIFEAVDRVRSIRDFGEQCSGRRPRYTELIGILDSLEERKLLGTRMEESAHTLRKCLPELPETICLHQAEKMFGHLRTLKQAVQAGSLDHRLANWILEQRCRMDAEAVAAVLREALERKGDLERFYSRFAGAESRMSLTLGAIFRHLSGCAENFEDLEGWVDLRNVEAECSALGLGQFVLASAEREYPSGRLMDVFLKSFYRCWTEALIPALDRIDGFRVHSQNQAVEDFCRLDERQLPVDQMRIREKLTGQMPTRGDHHRAADEMSILLHELGKKRNIMALRKLFRAIPNLLLRLKPCLMMSPMSVAHFLEGDTYRFDMVIFDEASQIFPQDAVGAIFRGRQVIIAGDSNQLPPTNFFSASTSNNWESEEEGEEEVCFDSILEAAAGNLPNRSLLWHYRSRYEELIAFSNREIYGNHLITFPSSTIGLPDTGVEYVYVEKGVYENRSNRLEALRIVELVEEHILRNDGRSMGIIAFSEAQQAVIEDEIHKFRLRNPRYEHFFDENAEEPFFVKNLENVQGDERDTILFSVCYGKNARGVMYMRFGPLGMEGGERRLNVAITRAKRNIKLVGSILPEEIDLRKTQAEGVRLLRSYIAFAMHRQSADRPAMADDALETDLFVTQVARFLEEKGCKVATHLGSSEYTVDIAVEHPGKPGCFLAGIECDGHVYCGARTVRDRDHLRPNVMRNMGWNLYRVWSVAWMMNPKVEQQRLMDFLQEALLQGNDPKKVKYQPKTEPEIQLLEVERQISQDPDNPYDLPLYTPCDLTEVEVGDCGSEYQVLQRRIMALVQQEQPVHLDILCRSLAESLGAAKVTPAVRESVLEVLDGSLSDKVIVEEQFVRFGAAQCTARRSPPGQPHRDIEYISVEEIACAMEKILAGSFGIERNVLFLETARVFGFERMGSKIRQRTELALEELLRRRRISLTEDKVQLMEV